MTMLKRLKNRHAGEVCVLVANGPSLNRMDLRFLRHNVSIGLNKIYLGLSKFHFYPNYYVCINPKVLKQSVSEIKAMTCVKFLSLEAARDHISSGALTHLIRTENPSQRFSTDLTNGLHQGWTVTYAALQIAYYLGFKTVILIGLDHEFIYSGLPNATRRMVGEDPNHFCGDYFSHGQQWDNPDLRKSEESYQIARQVFESDGRQILDATFDGKCTVFPKIDYRDYFGLQSPVDEQGR